MKYHLPIVIELAVREAESARRLIVQNFEAKVRGASADTKTAVTCMKGCNHCCHYPVVLSVLEGVTLFRWLSDHGLWKPLKEALKVSHQKVWGLSPAIWMLSMTPCPLLDAKGLCSAYEGRPYVCQTTVSFRNPHFCHPHRFAEGEAGIVPRREVDQAVHVIEDRLLQNLRLSKLRLPLSTAVLLGERICKEELEPQEANDHLFEEWARHC